MLDKCPSWKLIVTSKAQNSRAEIDQPQSIFLCNKGMGGGHSSKKWWWPVFRFCLDLSVNKAYQLYCQPKHSEGEGKLDLLGFRQSIFDTYYVCLRKSTTTNIFSPARKLSKVSDEVRYHAINHWIGKPLWTFVKNAMLDSIQTVTDCNL